MQKRYLGLGFLVLLIIVGVVGLSFAQEQLQVYFLAVGQAESTLLVGPEFTILIDAGDRGENDVVPHLKRLGITEIDLFWLTHPHADHIGQAADVLREFKVAEIWMSGYEHTTVLFEAVLDAILDSEAAYYEPRRGEVIHFGDLALEILHPETIGSDLHDTNIVVRAVYGEVVFLFTGDAERKTETKILASGLPVKANILQLGHHGSRTSTSLDFLLAVKPQIAIYSAGVNNPFGHPHPEVMDRLQILDIPVYGTDVHGTIAVQTDGTNFQILVTNELVDPHPLSGGVDINNASLLELQRIIHIGPVLAQAIIDLRAVKPFTSVDDLQRVSGLGARRIADIKKQGLAYVKEDGR